MINRWAAIPSLLCASRPSAAKSVAMPPDDSVRLHNHPCGASSLRFARRSRSKESHAHPKSSSRPPAAEGCQLLPQGEVFQSNSSALSTGA